MTYRLLLCVGLMLLGGLASAHELQTASLRFTESAGGRVLVTLSTPLTRDGQPSAVIPVFDARCLIEGAGDVQRIAERVVRTWPLRCREGLRGARLTLQGLDPRTPEAVVMLNFADGQQRTLTMDRHDPKLLLEPAPQAHAAASLWAYLPIGIEHILLGPDHLLFVLGLMAVVAAVGGRLMTLAGALTAFTVAHSLTLGLSLFGVWGLPSGPVEILIALSIVLLALELSLHNARQQAGKKPTLSLRQPWLAAFAFGLLHGFGFAGALSEIGLPEQARAWALLLFNLGVEAGQLIFVIAVLALVHIFQVRRSQPAGVPAVLVVLIGALGVYWTLDRTSLWLHRSGLFFVGGA